MHNKLISLVFFLSIVPSVSWARDSVEMSSNAQSQNDLVVTVWCKDGSFFRGEPLEYVPNDHVTLRLSDGKALRLEWDRVSNVAGVPKRDSVTEPLSKRTPTSSKIQQPPALPSSNEPTFDAFSSREKRRIRSENSEAVVVNMPLMPGNAHVPVRFTGMGEGAMIEYLASSSEISGWTWPGGFISGSAETWKAICALPCRLNADRDRPLRISGADIVDSKSFYLPTRGDRFEVEIKPGWYRTRTAAWAVMGVGIGIGVIGSIVAGLTETTWADPVPKNFLITGGAMMGVGLVTTLSSIPIFLKSRTDVEIYNE